MNDESNIYYDDGGEIVPAVEDDAVEIQEISIYIIVNYIGSFFSRPAVTKVKKKAHEVSCMVKCGQNTWK